MKRLVGLMLMLSTLLSVVTISYSETYRRIEGPRRWKAVSLRVLQEQVKTCLRNDGSCPDELLQFFGITRITGYILDEERHDVILIGEVDTTLPPLHIEDWVVALRNVSHLYATRSGRTTVYAHPACSIDPYPQTVQRLQRVMLQSRGSDQAEAALDEWHNICRFPQNVNIWGIPFDSHMARVMVTADYDMKRVVDGSLRTGVNGFDSLMDMAITAARRDLEAGRPLSIPLPLHNRFWFTAGETSFLEERGAVFLKTVQVQLKTKPQVVYRGEVKDGGSRNPLAETFADSFSAHYEAIAREQPIYQELEAQYRWVALAKILKKRVGGEEIGVLFEFFLNQYPLPRVPVERTLAGVSRIEELRHRQPMPGGYREVQLWLPSCGGVSIDVPVGEGNFVRDSSLLRLKGRILGARPSAQAVTWEFSGPLPIFS